MFKFLKKNKEENNGWIVYKDELGDNPAILRVDTSYVNKKYKNTLSINIKYDFCDNNKLPNTEQKTFIDQIEDMILDKIKESKLSISFVGVATFNGASYLIFVTNEAIDWESFITKTLPYPRIDTSMYLNDNMGYYNNVLYPMKQR